MLTGGSAFGLAAADGAMRWLEERGRGYATPGGLVPIVPGGGDLRPREPATRGARPDAGGRLRGLRGGGRRGARARPGRRRHRGRGRQDRRARAARRATGVGYAAARTGLGAHGGRDRGRQRVRRRDRRGRRGAWPGSAPRAARRRSTAATIAAMDGGARLAPGRGAQHDAGLRDHRRAARQAGLLAGRADGERRASPAPSIRCSPTSTATSPSASPPARRRAPTASAPWRSGTVAATVTAAAIRDSARA